MNRETQAHFAELPSIDIGRSKFNRSFKHLDTFNVGELVPVYVDPDIIPGDSVTMKQAELIRMMTPIAPVMDDSFMDFYWFFIPDRLVMDEWQELMGENKTEPWTQTKDITIPQIKIGSEHGLDTNVLKGSVLDHMGIPTTKNWEQGEKEISISALPSRAYCLVWNEFFRDENLQNPINIHKDSIDRWIQSYDTIDEEELEQAEVEYAELGGLKPLKVCKTHDYFTSCLPEAQKGPAVSLPFSESNLPVELGKQLEYHPSAGGERAYYTWENPTEADQIPIVSGNNGINYKVGEFDEKTEVAPEIMSSDNMWQRLEVDLTKATGATVTALRQAFAIQKFYERDARGGTRYIESIKSHFGVTNPDFRFQRPEYLGGFRQNINMNQIVQSAPLEANTTPLGTTGAYSVTAHQDADVFTHSFTEHGILLGLCCIRTNHTYQQGINRAWFKKKRLDFYSPEFANLSEQAVLNREIYIQGNEEDEQAFGYQECWAEMRYMPDVISGELRSNYEQSLDIWHYGDNYEELPRLGDKWIKEPKENVQRTLAIQNHDQFFADFYFGAIYTRPMPLYSIPGLIDHH